MAFATSDSYTADNANNNLRGLSIDNANSSHTGDTNETSLSTLSITGGTIGTTGALHIIAAGTITDSASAAKTIKLIYGSSTLATVSRTGANAQDWVIDAWLFNTAASAQRLSVIRSTTDANTVVFDYVTSSEDSATTLTLKVTGTLVNGADTVTQTMFDVFLVQVA